MFKITLVIIALFIVSCGTQENEQITPNVPHNKPQPARPKSARVADECESVSYGNGLTIDACEVSLGGTLNHDTYIYGNQQAFDISNLSILNVQVKAANGNSIYATNTDETKVAGISFNQEEVALMASDNGIESGIQFSKNKVKVWSTTGDLEINVGPYNYTTFKIDASGNIIMPQLKARTSLTPVGALYDSAGFIKRKH